MKGKNILMEKIAIFFVIFLLIVTITLFFQVGDLSYLTGKKSISDITGYTYKIDFLFDSLYNNPEIPLENLTKEQKKYVKKFRKYARNNKDIPIEVYNSYYEKIGLMNMLLVIDEDKFCHVKAHNLGRVVLQKTEDFLTSISICDHRCRVGCIHGVFLGLFENVKEEQSLQNGTDEYVLLQNLEVIKGMCNNPEVINTTGQGECYHATGHAITFLVDYNISLAIEACNIFESEGKVAVYSCAAGAYMERDVVFGWSDTEKSILEPCKSFDEHPAACYQYSLWRAYGRGYTVETIAEHCLTLNDPQRRGCFHGLGVARFRVVYENPKVLGSICKYGDIIDQRMCINGLIWKIKYHLSEETAKEACDSLQDDRKTFCYEALKHDYASMGKNHTYYYYIPQNHKKE